MHEHPKCARSDGEKHIISLITTIASFLLVALCWSTIQTIHALPAPSLTLVSQQILFFKLKQETTERLASSSKNSRIESMEAPSQRPNRPPTVPTISTKVVAGTCSTVVVLRSLFQSWTWMYSKSVLSSGSRPALSIMIFLKSCSEHWSRQMTSSRFLAASPCAGGKSRVKASYLAA